MTRKAISLEVEVIITKEEVVSQLVDIMTNKMTAHNIRMIITTGAVVQVLGDQGVAPITIWVIEDAHTNRTIIIPQTTTKIIVLIDDFKAEGGPIENRGHNAVTEANT